MILNEALFGKTKDRKTWFQVESHSTRWLINFLEHIIDYILYKATGRNVSQYGYSKHRDSNPIEINFTHSQEILTLKYRFTLKYSFPASASSLEPRNVKIRLSSAKCTLYGSALAQLTYTQRAQKYGKVGKNASRGS